MTKRGHFLILNRALARIFGLMPRSAIKFLYNRARNTPGYLGLGLRYVCIKNLTKRCGENVAIFPGCVIKHFECLSIGNNVSIHHYCFIDAIGGISIGNDVSIANHTSLISFGHTWDNAKIPIKYNNLVMSPLEIADDVWIGCGVRIIGPCNIPSRTIIAAGAVVKGDILGNAIYGGVPAKMIKILNKECSENKPSEQSIETEEEKMKNFIRSKNNHNITTLETQNISLISSAGVNLIDGVWGG